MSAKPDKDHAEGVLERVALDAIESEEGVNPRRDVDKERLAELTASIKECGVLQPILVCASEHEKGGFALIAGQRRVLAAKAAGLTTIPAYVREVDGRAREFALVENLKRADLNPIEEACAYRELQETQGLKQKQLADKLQISPRLVSERLRLLELAEEVQAHIRGGKISAACGKELARVAKTAPAIAAAIAEAIATGELEAAYFLSNETYAVSQVVAAASAKGQWLALEMTGGWRVPLSRLPLDAETRKELETRVVEVCGDQPAGVALPWGTEDVDQARAYGCLLEVGKDWPVQLICDAAFVVDRARQKVQALIDKEQAGRSRGKRGAQVGGDTSGESGEEAAREERRKAHRKRQEAKERAYATNLQLGNRIAKRYEGATCSADVARLAVLFALQGDARSLASAGLRLTHADWQTVETKTTKAGKTRRKIVYLDASDAGDRLVKSILEAKTAEEILGRFVQAIVAAAFAKEECVAQSNRVSWGPRLASVGAGCGEWSEVRRILKKLVRPVRVEGLDEDPRV